MFRQFARGVSCSFFSHYGFRLLDLYLRLRDRITKNALCTGNHSWVLAINDLCVLYFVAEIDSKSG